LVDELDDPRPGHLSDHPTAITTTTSLQDRFVRAESSEEDERQTKRQKMDMEPDTMMDENDDKENQR
jgi:serine/threonine-protein phosphatase 4 regulatory subunit 2